MKRTNSFLLLLLALSLITGYLLSKASLVSKVGMDLFYKEYRFLKVWWKGAAVVFIVWLLLFFLQGWAQKKLSHSKAVRINIIALVLAVIGLFATYLDFRHTLTHRLLGERFHIGGYLFWLGWMCISLFYLFQKNKDTTTLSAPPAL